MDTRDDLRKGLEEAELKLFHYRDHLKMGIDGLSEYYAVREAQAHYEGRRKYFLKQLLKKQLKEFR